MIRRESITPTVGSVNSPDMETFRSTTNLSGTRLTYLKHRLFEWRRRACSHRELMSLSDTELRDIGLSRSEAEFEVSKLFWLP